MGTARIWMVAAAMLALSAMSIDARASGSAVGIVTNIEGSQGSVVLLQDTAYLSEAVLGDVLAFTEDLSGTGIVLGATVTFEIVPGAVPGTRERAVTLGFVELNLVITGLRDDPVSVGAGQTVLITRATIAAKITANTGTVVIIGSSVIDGKVDIDNGSTLVMIGGSRVSGKVDSFMTNRLIMADCVVDGKVTSNQDRFVSIQRCTIGGKLVILSRPVNGCSVSNNTVVGQVDVPATCTSP